MRATKVTCPPVMVVRSTFFVLDESRATSIYYLTLHPASFASSMVWGTRLLSFFFREVVDEIKGYWLVGVSSLAAKVAMSVKPISLPCVTSSCRRARIHEVLRSHCALCSWCGCMPFFFFFLSFLSYRCCCVPTTLVGEPKRRPSPLYLETHRAL